ncbi:MAG TPA: hypothetical protein VNN80_22995 [Polyangiaceae bacterium]|nr:hypothetical protein [Polyangiaceae bacterium]
MESRRGWLVALLGFAGCARLVGLDELQEEQEPAREVYRFSPDAGSTQGSGMGGGGSGGASAAGQVGSSSAGSPGGGSAGAGGTTRAGEGGSGASFANAGGTGGEAAGASGSTGAGGSLAAAGSSGAAGATGGGVVFSPCPSNLLVNGGFEAGDPPWVVYTSGRDPLIYDSTQDIYEGVIPHGGRWLGWLGGVPSETNRLSQTVTVPAIATELALQGSLRVQLFEVHPNIIDYLRIRLVIDGEPVPLAQFTNADGGTDWVDLAPPPVALVPSSEPLTVTLEIESVIGAGAGTYFYVDDLALVPTCPL